jgi:hypothetical protein
MLDRTTWLIGMIEHLCVGGSKIVRDMLHWPLALYMYYSLKQE